MKLPIPTRELRITLWTLAGAGVIGFIVDALPWALAAGALIALLVHLLELGKLEQWLRDTDQDVPDAGGTWGEAYRSIHRLRHNERRTRDNLLNIIERARVSVAALEEAVALIDSEGNLEWWNPAAQKLLGLNTRDLGQPVANIIRSPAFLRYFQNGPYDEGIKLPSQRHPGRHLQYEITRFGDNDKLMIVYDITRVHNLEQMRKDFVANVSHELRTPLTVLSGYLETLLEQSDDTAPRWQKAFRRMDEQTQRMKNLVNDLLTLSRLENQGAEAAAPDTVHVPRMLRQILQDAQVMAAPKHQQVSLNADDSLLLCGIEGDLRSAFSNLVTNAVKYTPEGGRIDIRWWADDHGVHFEVQDNGIGIDREHIPRLTERFYRVDAGRSTATGGTGLGLAIVKHVLLLHRGTLDIHSRAGQGSRFRCSFPPVLLRRETAIEAAAD